MVRPEDLDCPEFKTFKSKILKLVGKTGKTTATGKTTVEESLLYLDKIEKAITHLLSDDVIDVYNVFVILPSTKLLTAQRNYVTYKIKSLTHKKHTHTHSVITSVLDLITNAQLSLLKSTPKKRPVLERDESESSLIRDEPPDIRTRAKTWY